MKNFSEVKDAKDVATKEYVDGSCQAKPAMVSSSLVSANWTPNNTYSFEDTYPSAQYDIELSPSSNMTALEAEAWSVAMIAGDINTNTVKALGEKPSINLPVFLKVVKK